MLASKSAKSPYTTAAAGTPDGCRRHRLPTACEVCGEREHTRICLTCGAVTCCESHEAHDHDHYDETGHPLIRPHQESYDFLWCDECEAYLTD